MTDTKAPAPGHLPPIPTPPSVWWSNVRARVLPILTFLLVLGAVVFQWTRMEGGGVSGIAEGVRMMVMCPQPALVQDLEVQPYQYVEAGQPIAILRPLDPRARLNVLQSELQLARLRIEPSLADRTAIDYERLRVEASRLRTEIAMAQVNLQRAENVLRRNELLRKDKLVSEDVYDLSLGERDVYRAEVAEKTSALKEIEAQLVRLRSPALQPGGGSNEIALAVLEDLDNKLQETQTNWNALTLVAPIGGMVHFVNHFAGEFVPEGEPLLTINSSKSDRIVGYLRQPYPVEPEIGMPVEVVTRSRERQRFTGEISQIGAQVEVITNALAIVRPFSAVDTGLPIIINIPPSVHIRPGETVDIYLGSKTKKRGFLASNSRLSNGSRPEKP